MKEWSGESLNNELSSCLQSVSRYVTSTRSAIDHNYARYANNVQSRVDNGRKYYGVLFMFPEYIQWCRQQRRLLKGRTATSAKSILTELMQQFTTMEPDDLPSLSDENAWLCLV